MRATSWIIAAAIFFLIGDIIWTFFNNAYTRIFSWLGPIFLILVIIFIIIPYFNKMPRKEPTKEESISELSPTMKFIYGYVLRKNIQIFGIFVVILIAFSLTLGAIGLIKFDPYFLRISASLFGASILTFVIISKFVK